MASVLCLYRASIGIAFVKKTISMNGPSYWSFIFYRDKEYGTLHLGAQVIVNDVRKLTMAPHSLDTITSVNDTVHLTVGKEPYTIYPGTEKELFFKIIYKPSLIYFFGSPFSPPGRKSIF